MRLRTGHGPDDWSDVGAGYGGSIAIRGALVQGAPGPVEQARINSRQASEAARQRRDQPPKLQAPLRPNHRPRLSDDIDMNGRGRKYATDEERIAARRQAWRASKARKRAA